jgi:tetratricopeptide (TPR) repeat protein
MRLSRPRWYLWVGIALLLLPVVLYGGKWALEWFHQRAITTKQEQAREALEKGDVDLAIKYHGELIRLDPNNAEAHYFLANLLTGFKGKHDQAIAEYTEALRLNLDGYYRFLAYWNRGRSYRKIGEYDKASADYTEAIRLISLSPFKEVHLPRLYKRRGDIYLETGAYDKAIADYTEAIGLHAEDAEAYEKRGLAHEAKGERNLALADFTEAIRLDPQSAQAYQARAQVYRELGKELDAARDEQKAQELNQ